MRNILKRFSYPKLKLTLVGLCMTMVLGLLVFANEAMAQSKSFPVKGFHLDLRIQVMKMPSLKSFVKKLNENGVNTLIMEWEGSYPFEKHPVISNKYAYTRNEIKQFIAYCDSLGIDVIPLQQSFGHVEYILKHYRYSELREDPKDFSQVNPIKEDLCKALFADLFKDMMATHRSPYFHVGGDETYLLGHGKESKEKAAKVGLGRVYGDYLKMICELVVSLGKTPVVWADIALKYPDALQGLPKQTVFVDWNYGWELDRFGDHEKLVKSGFEIWGAPAIRSYPDTYFLTDWGKHLKNIATFIPEAKRLGYKGMVMTSWSTSGLYSNVMESSSDLIDIHAIRRVYPISGFNLLQAAFFKGLSLDRPLSPQQFVVEYAQTQFGFPKEDAQSFYRALMTAPYEVNQGVVSKKGMTIDQLADSVNHTLKTFKLLKVTKNKAEFEHLVLMTNIRYNYLVTVAVEAALNQPTFNFSQAKAALDKLRKLNTDTVDEQFRKLNTNLLYPAEIQKEESLRNHRIKELIAQLEALQRNVN